jgi:cell division protein FtsW
MAAKTATYKRTRQARLMRMRTDYVLVLVVAALTILGLMMVYSSTFDMAYLTYGKPSYFLLRQLIWTALGLGVLIALARIDYHLWQRWAVLLMAGTVLLLGAVVAVGSTKFGAQRWLIQGSVQPSEITKVAIVIYIAAWVASKGDKIRKVTYGLIPFALLIGLVTALILFQRDLSTAALIVATSWVMFFFAGADLLQLGAGMVFGGAALVFMVTREQYRLNRIVSFLNPWADAKGTGYQTLQGLMALASGGIFGKGIGASERKFGYVPSVHTDTVFAVLGEELGLIGCLVLLGLFVLLAYRGFKIALEASDPFGTILASGLTCTLILQALLNMAVVTGTVPYAGIPLPFISYGGSSLLGSMACVGLLLSISRGVRSATGARAKPTVELRRKPERPTASAAERY